MIVKQFFCNSHYYIDRKAWKARGLVVRASASQLVDLGLIPLLS